MYIAFVYAKANKAEPTLALEPRGNVKRNPKQGTGAVADLGGGQGGHAPPPRLVKIGQKKMAAEHGILCVMFLAPPPSEVSGSATEGTSGPKIGHVYVS